jgi:hypothetical protein
MIRLADQEDINQILSRIASLQAEVDHLRRFVWDHIPATRPLGAVVDQS